MSPADAGEMVDFQPFDLRGDGFAPGQQRRHDHQRAQMGGHAVAKLEAREPA